MSWSVTGSNRRKGDTTGPVQGTESLGRMASLRGLDLSTVLKSIPGSDLSRVLNLRAERTEPAIGRSLVQGLSMSPHALPSPPISVSCVLGLPGHSSL